MDNSNNTADLMSITDRYSFKKVISDERIRHMHGVAEWMYHCYENFHCRILTRNEIYVLGLNHDIGYIDKDIYHESYGAGIFAGFTESPGKNVLVKCILEHGSTPKEYMKFYGYSEDEVPRELILLWYADMCVSAYGEHAGEVVGFQARLDEVEEVYGKDDQHYGKCKETMEWLMGYMPDHVLKD